MLPLDEARRRLDSARAAGQVSESAVASITRWLTEPPFAAYRDRILDDIAAERWRALDDAFYAVLEFGTGGRRGRMYPVGTNVLNQRTIAESARGLADFLAIKKGPNAPRSVVVTGDARHNSKAFVEQCARVLAAAGCKVFLFDEPRTTPLLSFAVRHLKCDAGIMITASHNPPTDNGFKCYNDAGGQVVPPDDKQIIEQVYRVGDQSIPELPVEEGLASGQIVRVGGEVDDAYVARVVAQSVSPEREVSVVYTPMHGVGETGVGPVMQKAGYKHFEVLASQRAMDGDFPNVPGHVSNPEIPKTLGLAIERAKEIQADLVLATDPDADRLGVGLPISTDPRGEWTTLTGNQIGVVLTAYVLDQLAAQKKLSPGDSIITTLVSSQMAKAIASSHNVDTQDDLLVGFKWIGQRVDEIGPEKFVFGFEESHGYLRGDYARDKDGPVAAMLFSELAATLKARGETVLGYLDRLYLTHGHYGEGLINVVLEGRQGQAQIQQLMAAFRDRPPATVAGLKITEVRDYKAHEIRYPGSTKTDPLPRPSGDLLIFHLDEPGTRFAARPSGTEPKIKFYTFARTDTKGLAPADLPAAKARTTERLDRIKLDLEEYVKHVLQTSNG